MNLIEIHGGGGTESEKKKDSNCKIFNNKISI